MKMKSQLLKYKEELADILYEIQLMENKEENSILANDNGFIEYDIERHGEFHIAWLKQEIKKLSKRTTSNSLKVLEGGNQSSQGDDTNKSKLQLVPQVEATILSFNKAKKEKSSDLDLLEQIEQELITFNEVLEYTKYIQDKDVLINSYKILHRKLNNLLDIE